MKRLRLCDLACDKERHVLEGIVPAQWLTYCGAGIKAPGTRTHDTGCTCAHCDGKGRHAHDFAETFIILQGTAHMEINGTAHPMRAGDVIVCEPGEDHHLVAGEQCVSICVH